MPEKPPHVTHIRIYRQRPPTQKSWCELENASSKHGRFWNSRRHPRFWAGAIATHPRREVTASKHPKNSLESVLRAISTA